MKNSALIKYLGLGIILFCIDRVTKMWAYNLSDGFYPVNSFLSFDVVINRGFSWSIFHSNKTLLFVAVTVTVIALTAFVGFLIYTRWLENKSIMGEVVTFVGSLSNICDRFLYKGVVDFITVSCGDWVWPTFNIADVCIVVGVIIMMWQWQRE